MRDGTLRQGDNMFAQCLIHIVFSSIVSFFSFYLVWYFWLKRNKILNTYMQFLCKWMKIDCEIDCNAKGRGLRFCLGYQITQGWHCLKPWFPARQQCIAYLSFDVSCWVWVWQMYWYGCCTDPGKAFDLPVDLSSKGSNQKKEAVDTSGLCPSRGSSE